MRIKAPSPAMAIALIALFVALGGTAAAAIVTYARNAGAVNGKKAVSAGVLNATAAGKLVATARSGASRGKIPSRYLVVPPAVRGAGLARAFGRGVEVFDNGQSAPFGLAYLPGIGTLRATCIDQNGTAGKEDPGLVLGLVNGSGAPVNLARRIGTAVDSTLVPAGAVYSVTAGGSTQFEFSLYQNGTGASVTGGTREVGRNTASAACIVFGQSVRVAG
ncbi:MAG: hypothetical protein U0R70_05020 [Solirubrobacteraceae bacterium]